MAAVVERAPRPIGWRIAAGGACAAAAVGLGYIGLPDASVAAAVVGLAALAVIPRDAARRAQEPALSLLRSVAGRSAVAERLEGTLAASLEELVRHAGASAAVALVRRGDGGLCDAYVWIEGRLSTEELLWQEELAAPLEDGPGAPTPRLPTRLGRPRAWLGRPIAARGEVCGALLVLEPSSRDRGWVGVATGIIATQIGAAVVGERFDDRLARGYMATIEAMVNALEAKDPYTAGHSQRVCRYALAIAAELGFPDEQLGDLQTGAMLHDIGKIGVGDGVLLKPGRLSDAEFDEIKDHPRRGARIIDAFNRSSTVLSVVFHHHERYDGRGYPAGLRGVDIPLAARIVNVADAFDAMTTSRPYNGEPKTRAEGLAELRRGAGSQFDPRVVEALEQALARGA